MRTQPEEIKAVLKISLAICFILSLQLTVTHPTTCDRP